MAQGYFESGMKDNLATFELFFRSNPFNGGFTVLSGIFDAYTFLQNFQFTSDDLEYLSSLNRFTSDFLDYLSNLRFKGEFRGIEEGSIVFAHEPLVSISGDLISCQLVETGLLNIINYQTLIATKTARICISTREKGNVLEFGLRRAQGDSGVVGARAAMIGGAVGTSNVMAGKLYGLPVLGTHAHSWIQSFPSELEAFRAYARSYPESCVLLIDTYNTLKSGLPNAIKVAQELREEGHELKGVRIDSGDLGWLCLEVAKILQANHLPDVKIVLSGDLDEYVIESIVNQIIHSDNPDKFKENLIKKIQWGVGTRLITGSGDTQAALGGVYKIVELEQKAVIKIAENRAKTTNPAKKKLWRIKSETDEWIADVIGLSSDKPPALNDRVFHVTDSSKSMVLEGAFHAENLLIDLFEKFNNKEVNPRNIWKESQGRTLKQLKELDSSHKRFLNPHEYKVSLSESLHQLKQDFILKLG